VLFIKILILAVLLLIFIQDIRSRSVYWFLCPVLAALFVIMHLLQHRLFAESWQTVLINTAFLALQFSIVSLYFSLKNRRWVNIATSLLGWGDILFLICLAFYLSVLNFLFFYIVSLMVVLLAWTLWQIITKEKSKQIPLAGLQAVVFLVFLTCDWWFKLIDPTNDAWLARLIMKWIR
jgi:hypothetical protein